MASAPDKSTDLGCGTTSTSSRSEVRLHRVLAVLLCINLAFLALHLAIYLGSENRETVFNLDAEANPATWWSSVQLLLSGLLLAVVAIRNARNRSAVVPLGFLAFLLIAMSLDEVSSLHERAGHLVDWLLGPRSGTRFHKTGLWFVAIGLPFALVVGIALARLSRFLADVPGTRTRMLVGFAVLLSGALGAEALSNFVISEEQVGERMQIGRYVILAGMEEFLEMSGGSLLLWASLGLVLNHPSTRGLLDHLKPLA